MLISLAWQRSAGCSAEACAVCAQIDDVLGQAHAVTGNLKDQRGILDNVGSKLENVAARFPMVTGLLNAIRRKKNRVRPCSPAQAYCAM